MATKTTVILDDDDDDDEIIILSTTPAVFKRAAKTTIDLTADDDSYDVVPTPSSAKRRRRFYKGESSNSKTKNDPVFNQRSFTCEICTDEKPMSDSFNITGCSHFYCTQCISNYVAAKLHNNIISINCPVPDCRGFLEPPHCREILPKAVFDRWGDALCEALILGKESYYCPYKNCSALLIVDANDKLTQSECPECRRLFCFACNAAWHSGKSCEEFKRRSGKDKNSDGDLKLENLAKKRKWKRCPKCRIFVSKKDGCDTMSCRCGCKFCYECGDEIVWAYCSCVRIQPGLPLPIRRGPPLAMLPDPLSRLYNLYAARFQ